jgi:hypothetical protein
MSDEDFKCKKCGAQLGLLNSSLDHRLCFTCYNGLELGRIYKLDDGTAIMVDAVRYEMGKEYTKEYDMITMPVQANNILIEPDDEELQQEIQEINNDIMYYQNSIIEYQNNINMLYDKITSLENRKQDMIELWEKNQLGEEKE